MTHDEHSMLAFAMKWLPYGGGDEQMLPEFGLVPSAFYQRLQTMLISRAFLGIEFATRQQLLEQCAVKLSNPTEPIRRKRKGAQIA
ncbi:DUF3263 domain-containing protein [Rhodococcus opacus]|uniref:DUF3263 domain-containing protein n=1 Tax=Rhodococcus opacus TaxID=37919 RepID=UPI000EA85F99|nr:DUF3263 domain-containing protein [Rhodococcus opacus]QZS52629.1 DUF3263 domain-containing protein [Rhodococcus opacus]RKM65331.1 hypothetical protein COO55_37985 [Rhodococcus opacus]